MEIYKAPQKYPKDRKFTIFLGGTIELGNSEDWQSKITQFLSTYNFDIRVLNPRRDDFDASQEQSIKNPYFKEQVNWELDGLDVSDLIIMYLQPGTKSPISMMETGLHINTLTWNKQMVICAPEGFYRKGNVEIMVDRYPYHSTLVETFEDLEIFVTNYLLNI